MNLELKNSEKGVADSSCCASCASCGDPLTHLPILPPPVLFVHLVAMPLFHFSYLISAPPRLRASARELSVFLSQKGLAHGTAKHDALWLENGL